MAGDCADSSLEIGKGLAMSHLGHGSARARVGIEAPRGLLVKGGSLLLHRNPSCSVATPAYVRFTAI